MTKTTLRYLAKTLAAAERDGLIRKGLLEELSGDLLDAHMSMSMDAEETGCRLTERRGELLGEFGDEIEEACDRIKTSTKGN